MNRSFGTPGVRATTEISSVISGSISSFLYFILIFTEIFLTNELIRITTKLDLILGAVGVDEMMVSLLHAVELYRSQQSHDIREEEEREARERDILEQNEA